MAVAERVPQVETDPETIVKEQVRALGADFAPAFVVEQISSRTGLAERTVRRVIWSLLAEGKIELSTNRRLFVR